jgi:hypothetical protein
MTESCSAVWRAAHEKKNEKAKGRAFLSIPGSTSTVRESTMLETVWIDKDTFQFSAVA